MDKKDDQLFNNLLAAFIAGSISDFDKKDLLNLAMNDPHYKAEFDAACRVYSLLHVPSLKSWEDENYEDLKKRAGLNKKRLFSKSISGYRNIAITILWVITGSILSIFIYKKVTDLPVLSNLVEISTPLGGQTKMILPDGSTAWINAKSELTYNSLFGRSDRHSKLTGEGYFEVCKNTKLPFTIEIKELKIVATGTKFNIRSYENENISEICLIEGGVEIHTPERIINLNPEEKVIYNNVTKETIVTEADIYRTVLWIKGKLSFERASLTEILKNLERHFNVEIQVESEQLKDEHFLGTIDMEMDLYRILKYIDVYKKYEIETKDNVITIKDKKQNTNTNI